MGQFSKKWEDLDFSDNFIFCKVMRDEYICKKMLEILLHLQIEKIEYLDTEHQLENYYDSKGIRMDVFLKDSSRVIDIEMQTGDYEDLLLRARYYQSAADISTVPRRTKYKDLKENYIIFICKNDPFGKGFYRYSKKLSFDECDTLDYNDKTHNVFYNASAYAKVDEAELRGVLEFIYNMKADSDFTRQLEFSVENAKAKSVFKDEYMYFSDILEDEKEQAREAGHAEGLAAGLAEGLAEGREKGLAEGRAEGETEKNNMIKNLLKLGVLSVKQIAEVSRLPVEQIEELKVSM